MRRILDFLIAMACLSGTAWAIPPTAFDGGNPINGTMSPQEAWNIDSKIDDGMPAQGKLVVVSKGNTANCTTAASQNTLTGTYLLTSEDRVCALIFRNQF
jgi:hypothetical protein